MNNKKELEKLNPPPKFYYDVKIEALLPATITYRILAENPNQAVSLIKGQSPISVKHRLIGRKELKLMVYEAGSSILRLTFNLWNK